MPFRCLLRESAQGGGRGAARRLGFKEPDGEGFLIKKTQWLPVLDYLYPARKKGSDDCRTTISELGSTPADAQAAQGLA